MSGLRGQDGTGELYLGLRSGAVHRRFRLVVIMGYVNVPAADFGDEEWCDMTAG